MPMSGMLRKIHPTQKTTKPTFHAIRDGFERRKGRFLDIVEGV